MSCFLGFQSSSKSYTVFFTFKEAVTSSTLFTSRLWIHLLVQRGILRLFRPLYWCTCYALLVPSQERASLRCIPSLNPAKPDQVWRAPHVFPKDSAPNCSCLWAFSPSCRVRTAFCTYSLAILQACSFPGHGWTERVRERQWGIWSVRDDSGSAGVHRWNF